ncbi:MAG: hypothetical protein ABIP53_08155 [Candidatus Limnocylindrales bacterium]
MNKIRVSLSLALASLLIASCATVGPGFTIPPITIPSFSIPSFAIPSFDLPPGFTIPPIVVPSGLPTLSECTLVTAAEVGGIWGTAPTTTENTDGDCTFTFSNFSTVIVSIESATDLSTSRFLFGETAKDTTIAGLAALTGSFIGQPAVHVQRNADQMQVMGILTGSDDATIAKLVQVAALAVSRWP